MATKNNGITRADAIKAALQLVNESAEFDDNWVEVSEVLTKMHQQLTKPRATTETKAHRENVNLAAKVRDAISAHGDGVGTKWIAENVTGILTTQKAAAVCRVGVELGYLTKCVNGKAITYALA